MKKIITIAVALCMATGLIFIASNKAYSKLDEPDPKEYKLIISDKAKDVYIYGKKIDSQPYYNQVLVKTKEAQKLFDWKATDKNPSLIVKDITGSGKDNVAIIFITSYGTGAYKSSIHIVGYDLKEDIKVADPAAYVKDNIKTEIEGQNVIFSHGDKKYTVTSKAMLKSPEDAMKNLQFGSVITYSILNEKLYASVSAQVSPYSMLGAFILEYDYKDGEFVPQIKNFKEY